MSAAFVAVTIHVPAEVNDNVEPATEHPVAVPLDAIYETAPVPDPPEVVRGTDVGYVPVVLVTVSAAWLPLVIVNVCSVEDIEL